MLNLSLKQAETAFAKGRLDEAFSLVREESARNTRQAQLLVARLVDGLVVRGQEHLDAGRLSSAASDAAKAVELGGQQAAVADLFEAVHQAKDSFRKQQQHEQGMLREARRQIDRGGASVGKKILDRAGQDRSDVQQLTQQLDVQRELNDSALRRARAAIDDGQYGKGLELLARLRSQQPDHPEVGKEIERAMSALNQNLRSDLRTGRLDRVLAWSVPIESVASESAEARELTDVMKRLRNARSSLQRSAFEAAERELGLLGQLIPDADWIDELRSTLREVVSGVASLQSGPLGLIDIRGDENRPPNELQATVYRASEEHVPVAELISGPPLPSRLLLQVDGVGSVLFLRSDAIRIGAATRSESIEIPLMTDGMNGSAEIRRDGEDYFLNSAVPVDVNGRQVTSRLLANGDVISLGRRGRVRFSKPIAASATAILELTGAPMQRMDVRRIVLFADSLIFGRESGSHVPVRDADGRYVVYQTGPNALAIRGLQSGGRRQDGPAENVPIQLDQSIVVDGLRLRFTKFDKTPAGQSRLHRSGDRS